MNRRTFLKSTAAVSATLSSGPLLLGTEDKAGSKAPRVGTGEHTYECDHNWGQLPPDYAWQTTHNVAVDSQGHVYVTHQGLKAAKKNMDTVMVFDPQGKFVRSFGQDWHGGGHGVEIRKEGSEEFIYLSNTWTEHNKLVKTNLKGEVVWVKGRPECKEYDYRIDPKDKRRVVWPAYNPTNISWLPDGGFTVGDGYGSNYLLNYDKDGKLRQVFSGTGAEPGKCRTPHGNWLDTRDASKPAIVVCDRANARLQRFDLDGKPLSATEPNKVVLFPAHAKTRGDVLLVPDLHARVSLFDKENNVIAHLGEDEAWRKKVLDGFKVRGQPKEWLPGKFVHPHDACFDAAGNIFVVEWVATGRVSFLKRV
jgi:hypothetical protein